MAFDAKGLTTFDNQPAANRRWTYQTTDAQTAVAGAGYFSSYAKGFEKGDIIDVVGSIGGTPTLRSYVVTAVTKPEDGTASVTIALSSATAA